MSLLRKLRHITTTPHHHRRRHFSASASAILNPDDPKTPLTSKQKSRFALSLLKSESNPEKILSICRAAALSPITSRLDRIALSVAVSKLTSSNYFSGLRSFLLELPSTRPDLRNEQFLSHSIVLFGKAKMLEDALKVFDEIPQPSTKPLAALLFACRLAGDYDELKRVYLQFPKKYDIELDLDCYNAVIKAFCESGSSSSVYSVLAEMDRKRIKPNAVTMGTLISGFYREEKYDEVGKVLDLMIKKYEMIPGVSIYNSRIHSLCKLKKSVEAMALLDGMVSRGMRPNCDTYIHLIHGFCKEGKLEEAKGLFEKAVNSGFHPDSDCYFTLVYFLCEGGDFEAALRFCKESMKKNWVPNFGTMKSLVNGLASNGKVDEARELIGQMKEKFSKNADMWSQVEEGFSK